MHVERNIKNDRASQDSIVTVRLDQSNDNELRDEFGDQFLIKIPGRNGKLDYSATKEDFNFNDDLKLDNVKTTLKKVDLKMYGMF